jgi:hypothetical protein
MAEAAQRPSRWAEERVGRGGVGEELERPVVLVVLEEGERGPVDVDVGAGEASEDLVVAVLLLFFGEVAVAAARRRLKRTVPWYQWKARAVRIRGGRSASSASWMRVRQMTMWKRYGFW